MDEEERRRRRRENALGALAAASSVDTSVRRLAEVYRKPLEYTGNRKLFDDGMAKRLAKENLFASGRAVKDPYTGEAVSSEAGGEAGLWEEVDGASGGGGPCGAGAPDF